ncbi:signal peptidase I [Tenacibaculum sp. M341]|uniref:signal peptidase I n=1 Tax=Tenacibaculum sp. M341 TaxID=2530339 RepID=UPI001045D739|nr:signal peptidase I [Tenacibaculum sp. M341]TCI84432.1 signal peptidase I [Tenacibaculum sp. M341]
MSLTGWFILFLIVQVIHFFGTWKLYVKAERKAWEAAVPVYNAIVLLGIIKRPKWWVILLFIPIVNLIMFPVLWIETCRSFGYKSTKDTFLVIFTLGFYIYAINYSNQANYRKDRSLKAPSGAGEWVSSIAFAIVAATIVHNYFIRPYVIPSSSLEKSLLIGDYLFVSKFHYGARVPMSTVALPMIHDTIPVVKSKSYLFSDDYDARNTSLINKLQLPYLRLPGLKKIKRNDIVVFGQPADTLLDMNNLRPDRNYYKPIDKKTNLVKRCVGIAGDSLEIRDGYIYINGKRSILPQNAKPQWYHEVDTDGQDFSLAALKKYNVRLSEAGTLNGKYILNLTDEEAKQIAKNPIVKSVTKRLRPAGYYDGSLFPHNPKYAWSQDNFGPIYIPKKGATVELNESSIPFYKRIIQEYEKNDLAYVGNDIYINGKKTNTYTFKQDYYWMMGDNRQTSLDARAWGYVPFDHVIGTPVMIWFSYDNVEGKVRWDRIFTTVNNGETKSYFWIGILCASLILFFVFKPKKKKTA